jgi:hypothetical protein
MPNWEKARYRIQIDFGFDDAGTRASRVALTPSKIPPGVFQ